MLEFSTFYVWPLQSLCVPDTKYINIATWTSNFRCWLKTSNVAILRCQNGQPITKHFFFGFAIDFEQVWDRYFPYDHFQTLHMDCVSWTQKCLSLALFICGLYNHCVLAPQNRFRNSEQIVGASIQARVLLPCLCPGNQKLDLATLISGLARIYQKR